MELVKPCAVFLLATLARTFNILKKTQARIFVQNYPLHGYKISGSKIITAILSMPVWMETDLNVHISCVKWF